MKNNIIIFKGIKFYNYSFTKIVSKIDKGGYLVAPAASALSNISSNKKYHESLKKADVAIFDSGFFCILLRIFKGKKINKLSGYFFLKSFLNMNFKKKTKFLTVDPTVADSKINKLYLRSKNIKNVKSYIAPKYEHNNVYDQKLIKLIKKYKPKYIIINIGGEIQEILGLFIKNNTNNKTSIICTGAAIAFLTKRQAPINDVIDKFYLGWLARILFNPRKSLIRTIKSLYLIKHVINE